MYRAGRTTYEIAARFGVSPVPITSALKRMGVARRPGGRRGNWTGSAKQQAAVVEAYQAGEAILPMARRMKVNARFIIAALDAAGVARRHQGSRQMLDEETVDQIVAGYAEGATLPELAARHGLSNHVTIRNYLVRRGVELRPPGRSRFWTSERKSEAARRYQAGESQAQIAALLGCNQTGVSNALRDLGVLTRKPHLRRENHPSWRGGRVIDGHGYIRVRLAKADADLITAHHNGYVLEHRLVMARLLGRPLERHETVHHVNGDRKDNRLENLQLRRGPHGNGVAVRCRDCGSHNVETVGLS